jgi:hypothetical protein
MHEHNAFITLTYNDENLPVDHSIHKEELQKFFKRLRKNTGVKIRYFACGEYGSKKKTFRPHYHAVIFGYDFPDKRLWSKKRGNLLYTSKILDKAWQHKGWASIGDVTFESAAYVARYTMKKRKGDPEAQTKDGRLNKHYYQIIDFDTGEVMFQVEPEFCLMSRNPGLGSTWLAKYKGDVEKDFLTLLDGSKHAIPKYYDALLEKEDETEVLERKQRRQERVVYEENTLSRLRDREKVKEAQIANLKRGYEDDES